MYVFDFIGFSVCILGFIVSQDVILAGALHLSAFSGTSTPLALKGEDSPNTRPPPRTKMISIEALGFPSLHVDTSRPQGTAGVPSTSEGTLVTSPALQPSPGEFSMEDQYQLYSISSGVCPKVHPKTHFRDGGWDDLQGDLLWVTSKEIPVSQKC